MSEKRSLDAHSSLNEWLTYLTSIHTSAIDLGLDRVSLVANKGNLTKPAPKIITVAGTNGKGSTCAILEAILQKAGYKTGVYSSPHLVRYNERVRINGKELDDKDHCKAFSVIEELREKTTLSIFEFGTLAAFWLMLQNKVDVAILEVGLGGRLDATNVAEPDISVITSLAVDHVDWLGDDIEKIGLEKAGIFRKDKPAVCGEPNPPATVSAYADEISAKLYQVGIQFSYKELGDTWYWQSGAFDLSDLPVPNLPLANAATAIMALGLIELDISDEDIVFGLQKVNLAGRMQQISQSPMIILDVAHNPHSANYLSEKLKMIKKQKVGEVFAVVGMLKDKDIPATLSPMLEVVDHWYPASLYGERAADWQTIASHIPNFEKIGFASPTQAFKTALKDLKNQKDILIVFGSFFTVGEITDYLTKTELT